MIGDHCWWWFHRAESAPSTNAWPPPPCTINASISLQLATIADRDRGHSIVHSHALAHPHSTHARTHAHIIHADNQVLAHIDIHFHTVGCSHGGRNSFTAHRMKQHYSRAASGSLLSSHFNYIHMRAELPVFWKLTSILIAALSCEWCLQDRSLLIGIEYNKKYKNKSSKRRILTTPAKRKVNLRIEKERDKIKPNIYLFEYFCSDIQRVVGQRQQFTFLFLFLTFLFWVRSRSKEKFKIQFPDFFDFPADHHR